MLWLAMTWRVDAMGVMGCVAWHMARFIGLVRNIVITTAVKRDVFRHLHARSVKNCESFCFTCIGVLFHVHFQLVSCTLPIFNYFLYWGWTRLILVGIHEVTSIRSCPLWSKHSPSL